MRTGPKHSGQNGVDLERTGLCESNSVTNGDSADWA